MTTKILLRALNLSWINDTLDDPHDLCAHGLVEFMIDDRTLVSRHNGDFTVSAAAIHLLRTLEKDHTPEQPQFEHMFPHCGIPLSIEPGGGVWLSGCDSGVDCHIRTRGPYVQIRDQSGNDYSVSAADWQRVVLSFSKTVGDFYTRSSPKDLSDPVQHEGFEAMRREWQRLDPRIEHLL